MVEYILINGLVIVAGNNGQTVSTNKYGNIRHISTLFDEGIQDRRDYHL